MKADGSLTEAGKVRDGMTAKERAIDRAAKGSPSPKTSFKYNVKTNRATKKR